MAMRWCANNRLCLVATALVAACATEPAKIPADAAPEAPLALAPAPIVEPSAPPAELPQLAALEPSVAAKASPEAAAPPASLYRCRVVKGGQASFLAIEFSAKVEALCRRHPEMGPCQYEREACRRSGGRVFDAKGEEITRKTEAEYDKRVLRLKFRS